MELYVLKDYGIKVAIMIGRARIAAIQTTDRYDNIVNIAPGYSELDAHIPGISSLLRAAAGRYANTEISGQFKDVANVVLPDSIAVDVSSG